MKKNPNSQSGLFNPRALLAFALCSVGTLLAMLSFAATPPGGITSSVANSPRDSLLVDQDAGQLSGNATTAAASGWSIVSSPNTSTTQSNVLYGVSCASASDCWAVGYYNDGNNITQTLIEQYTGTAWSIATSAKTHPADDNFLKNVSCASAANCAAVGYY